MTDEELEELEADLGRWRRLAENRQLQLARVDEVLRWHGKGMGRVESVERLHARIEELQAWKAEALVVLAAWEDVWDGAGRPGVLGESKAQGVADHIQWLSARLR